MLPNKRFRVSGSSDLYPSCPKLLQIHFQYLGSFSCIELSARVLHLSSYVFLQDRFFSPTDPTMRHFPISPFVFLHCLTFPLVMHSFCLQLMLNHNKGLKVIEADPMTFCGPNCYPVLVPVFCPISLGLAYLSAS